MNPLSAIPSLPNLSNLPLSGLESMVRPAQAAGAAAIPTAELRALSPVESAPAVSSTRPSGEGFAGMLSRMVHEVNAKQLQAGEAVQQLHSGGNVSLHQAVIAMEEASVSFLLMVEVRNKLLESYQELMRMQV